MDATVTARVPVEIKEQGNALLKSMGSSPTQLINAAYRYLLKEKRLPESEPVSKTKVRRLSGAQKKELEKSLEIMYLGSLEAGGSSSAQGSSDIAQNACADPQITSFKEQLNAARDDRYAHSS